MAGNTTNDQGDIVLSWLTRLVVALAVVALLGFDAVQVGLAAVQVPDNANDAAVAARDAYAHHHSVAEAYDAAVTAARADNPTNVVVKGSLKVQPSGGVTVELTRPIHTVLAHYLPVASFKTADSLGSAAANP